MTADQQDDFEPDWYLRRYSSFGDSYVVPVEPYPDECLEDLLIRAACENGFAPRMSYRLLGQATVYANRAPGGNQLAFTAESLATLLGNKDGPAGVTHLLHNEVPPSIHKSPFFDVWLDWRTLTNNRRVSPLALQKAPYLKAIWKVWPIGFDPETKETLLSNCPVCRKPLSTNFMGDIWCCDRCNDLSSDGELKAVDLREHVQPLIDRDIWEDLDFATSFIDPLKRDHRAKCRSQLHQDFAGLSDGDVFELIFALSRLAATEPTKAKRLKIPASHIASAARVVRGWPNACEEFISGVPRNSFRALVFNPRLSETARARLKEIDRASSIRSTMTHTGERSFGQSSVALTEFRILRKWIKRGSSETGSDVNVDTILFRSRRDIRDFALGTGVPVPSLVAMADDGLFPRSILREESRSMFPDYMRGFIDRLNTNSSEVKMPKRAVRLPRAVAALFDRVGDPWSVVFQAMLDGEIEYWKGGSRERFTLEGVFVDDLEALSCTLAKAKSRNHSLLTADLSRVEAASITRLQDMGFAAAVKAGLINAPINWYTLARFRAEYEPGNLLSVRYKLGNRKAMRRKMFASLDEEGVRPVLSIKSSGSITIWRRAEVERYFGADLVPCVG